MVQLLILFLFFGVFIVHSQAEFIALCGGGSSNPASLKTDIILEATKCLMDAGAYLSKFDSAGGGDDGDDDNGEEAENLANLLAKIRYIFMLIVDEKIPGTRGRDLVHLFVDKVCCVLALLMVFTTPLTVTLVYADGFVAPG